MNHPQDCRLNTQETMIWPLPHVLTYPPCASVDNAFHIQYSLMTIFPENGPNRRIMEVARLHP